MTDDREHVPASPGGHDDLGALTGATGSLTPDDPDEEFVPAETREVSDPGTARDVTAAAHRRRDQRSAEAPDDPGRLRALGERTRPNARDGGYGSEHGLAAGDPAYREEPHLPEGSSQRRAPGSRGGPDLGGDERRAPEEEHL